MNISEVLTPEDDLFGRIALFNKLVTLGQVLECAQYVVSEAASGKPRHSLASVLIAKGYLSSAAAAEIQKAVRAKAFERAGSLPPLAGRPPEPKPLTARAPAGDSQKLLAPRSMRGKSAQDPRFQISVPEGTATAVLQITTRHLHSADAPAFEATCMKLRQSGRKELIIDLEGAQHVPSAVIGIVGKVAVDARKAGQHLVLICRKDTQAIMEMVLGDAVETRIKR